MSISVQGSCNCSSVKFSAEIEKKTVHICHCNLCQKSMGGPSHTVTIMPGSLTIDSEESVQWFKSSDWAERGFCRHCGSNMFFRETGESSGAYQGVSIGMLDDKTGYEIDSHIFVDKKPSYYDFNDKAPRMTEKEFLEMVGAK